MNISSFCLGKGFLSSPYTQTLILKSAKSLLGIYHIVAIQRQPKNKAWESFGPAAASQLE